MVSSFLRQAWRELAGPAGRPDDVLVTGECDLPCPLPVADLAVGAVAAHRLAAAELHRTPGPVRVDAAHVGVAFASERYALCNGEPAGVGFAPLSRFWPTADGWVRLHGNFPHHRAAALRALGDDPGAAMVGMTGVEVESAVVGAGGVAAVVRTRDEWAAHPAGQALAGRGLLSLGQVAAAGAVRAPSVDGLRVLDLTRVIAGPVGTRTLASYGADVVRVDSPRLAADPMTDTGSGKRCCLLDLADSRDFAQFHELLAAADVLVHGYRPGALDRFGLDGPSLAQRRPGLVVVRLDAWGRVGPWGDRRGFDSIVQAASGIADTLRSTDGTPGALPVQALDHGTGHLLAAAVLRALTLTAERGGTWHAELSLARLAQWLLATTPPGPAGDTVAVDPQRYLVDLPSYAGTTTVVAPPGTPNWAHGPLRIAPDATGWTADQDGATA